MKKISLSSFLIFALSLTMLTACGSGGGSSSTPPPFQPTTAVLTLSTAVTGTIPANTTINGYDVTINLPAGVTVKGTTAIGAAAGATIISAGTTGKVRIVIANASGFSAGNFSTMNCNIAPGSYPTASDFQQLTFNVPPNPPGGGGASGWNNNTSSTVNQTSNLSLTATAVIN
jgi:uncharacterized membrane protein YfcA